MNGYVLGNLVRVSVSFVNNAGAAVDPTVVKLSVRLPDGEITTYTYGTDPGIVKTDTGAYYCDLDADEIGEWLYRWYSTGTGQAAAESGFVVLPSQFES